LRAFSFSGRLTVTVAMPAVISHKIFLYDTAHFLSSIVDWVEKCHPCIVTDSKCPKNLHFLFFMMDKP